MGTSAGDENEIVTFIAALTKIRLNIAERLTDYSARAISNNSVPDFLAGHNTATINPTATFLIIADKSVINNAFSSLKKELKISVFINAYILFREA